MLICRLSFCTCNPGNIGPFIMRILLANPQVPKFVCPTCGLDHGIGHLASMSPQKNERLIPSKG